MAALDLDARLALCARSREALAAAGEAIVDEAVAELGQPRRFAARELASALGLLDALPALAEAIRPRPVPAASGTTSLEWAPYGVVLGWHAANSPVWVPTLVAASALVGGNAVLARPSSRARATTGRVLAALAGPWPEGAVTVVDLPGPEAEPLVWDPGVHAVVTHASTRTCKRQLAGLGAAYAEGAPFRALHPRGLGQRRDDRAGGRRPRRRRRAPPPSPASPTGASSAWRPSGSWSSARPGRASGPAWWRPSARCGSATPDDPATDVAPLAEGRARAEARAALAGALACGGEVLVGEGERGPFFTPTVVALPREALGGLALWREETFAPLRGLVVAEDAEDALALANDTPFALGAAVFGPGEALLPRLRAARVLLNEGPLYQDAHLVVGGVGDSGMAGARPKVEQLVWARRVHRAAS